MNGRKAKRLRRKGREILVEWLQSIIPDETEANKITIKNLEEYLTEQTHVFMNNRFLLSAYSLKWIYKKVKRNPNLTLEQLQKDVKI
jgi:hypothetical protein